MELLWLHPTVLFFILTQDSGNLLRRLQVNGIKFIGVRAQQRFITTQIQIIFGRNIWPLSFISAECMVAPLLAEYSKQLNIPICAGATSYTMESGEIIILIFCQGLWFGNRMEKTLINPNQCQYFGIIICDDPNDQHIPLGIEADFNSHIPMMMLRFTCGFITWYPTNDAIDTCQHITILD